jgi:hypothetical protein
MQQEHMDNNITNIGFALIKVTTEQFAIIESNFEADAEIKLHLNFRFAADDKQKVVAVFSAFTFETNGKQFLLVEAGCHFSIAPESWEKMFDSSQHKLVVPKSFLQHMAMLTVGTCRGILHAKTENTAFNQYQIPTINVAEMVKKDNEFDFKEEN